MTIPTQPPPTEQEADYHSAAIRLRRASRELSDLSGRRDPQKVASLVDEARQCLTVLLINGCAEPDLTPVENLIL